MKRKIIAVVLSISLAVSFSACGNNSKSEATKEVESTDVAELQKQVEELQKENEKLKEQLAEVKEKTDSEDTGLLDNDLPDNSKEQEQETWSDDTVIAFTDEKMARDVRELIGVPEGNITYGMVKDIKEFNTMDDYSDITPLKYFTGLEKLTLDSFIRLPDLSPISNLPNLYYLRIHVANGSTDLTPITHLSNLSILDYTDRATKDISPIANLNSLETLKMSAISLTDISPIKNLSNLKRLQIFWANGEYDSEKDGPIQDFLDSI